MDTKDLVKRVKEENVKFVSLQFSDVTGAVKSVDMPVRHLEDALKGWRVVRWLIGGGICSHSGKRYASCPRS